MLAGFNVSINRCRQPGRQSSLDVPRYLLHIQLTHVNDSHVSLAHQILNLSAWPGRGGAGGGGGGP